MKPIVVATLYFGGMLNKRWIWSGIACPSCISISFWRHKSLIIPPTFFLSSPYIVRFRYFETMSIWYLQSHFTCDKLWQYSNGSSFFTPIASGAFLEGEPIITFQLLHTGPVEPLRVAPAELVVCCAGGRDFNDWNIKACPAHLARRRKKSLNLGITDLGN